MSRPGAGDFAILPRGAVWVANTAVSSRDKTGPIFCHQLEVGLHQPRGTNKSWLEEQRKYWLGEKAGDSNR
jgi:hypothetical protein